jgi:hypothetical protein
MSVVVLGLRRSLLFGCRHTDFPFEVILFLSDGTLDGARSKNKVRLANGGSSRLFFVGR